jgi:hypothetical protein
LKDFLAGNANGLRCFDGESDAAAAHFSHGDADITSDLDGFANFTAEHQHLAPVALKDRFPGSEVAETAVYSKITLNFSGDSRRKVEECCEIREFPDFCMGIKREDAGKVMLT